MKKRCMLAVTSLAVGFAASLAAPSAAHAAESTRDGVTPHLSGNHLLPLPLLDQLLNHQHQQPTAGGEQPTTSTTGNLLPGLPKLLG